MKKPYIRKVQKDNSIPWFEQIKKEIVLNGEEEPQIYYSIKPSDYVTILARTRDQRIIVLKQYRPAVEDYTYEFPSGHREEGETPEQAIIRELKEETGCIAEEVTLLGELIPDTGRLENCLWAFYADSLEVGEVPVPEDNDGIEVHYVTYEEFIEMINDGRFNHALDLSVFALAILNKHLKI